jgi:hypothetical protein
MTLRVTMVALFMLISVMIGTKPCKYFQLNARWFDGEKGIFSKIDIDRLIPQRWRLEQRFDDGAFVPDSWPVFVKPEWGQNAAGVRRADDLAELDSIRRENAAENIRYLVQQGAPESREFEVFWIRAPDSREFSVLTVSEALNSSERNPVNSVHNPATRYRDITGRFAPGELARLEAMMQEFGEFGIARASLRADSTGDMLAGNFHVIEINLFIPMPINMLDERYHWRDVLGMIWGYMIALARATRGRDKAEPEKPVFTKIMLYNRKGSLLNLWRARI